MIETRIQLFNQYCISHLNLSLIFFQDPLVVVLIVLKQKKMANVSAITINCQRLIHEPRHTKMGNFPIIVNCFQLFTIVAKSSIIYVVGFLDPSLHCNKFAAKAIGWFKSKQLYIHVYLREKYLNELEKHMFRKPILLNLQHYNNSSLSYNYIQVLQSLPWKTKFGVPFLR